MMTTKTNFPTLIVHIPKSLKGEQVITERYRDGSGYKLTLLDSRNALASAATRKELEEFAISQGASRIHFI